MFNQSQRTLNFVCHACSITNHVVFLFIDFSGGHLSVSSLRCLELRWQVVTLWVQLREYVSDIGLAHLLTYNVDTEWVYLPLDAHSGTLYLADDRVFGGRQLHWFGQRKISVHCCHCLKQSRLQHGQRYLFTCVIWGVVSSTFSSLKRTVHST